MGNLQGCFKRNKVAPEEMTIDKILSAGQSSPDSSKPYGRDEQEMLRQLKDEGIVPKRTNTGGVSFDVDIEMDKLLQRRPRRLTTIDSKTSQETLVYTSEEKSIVAEILRQEKLLQKKENARKRRRVHDEHDTKSCSQQQQVSDKMTYTSEDRVMMADILRQDLLVEKKDKTKKMRKVKFVEEASRYTKEEDGLIDEILGEERLEKRREKSD